jgi:prolyl oligopeptidase
MRGFSLAGDRLFVSRLKNACSQLTVHSLSGELLREIPLPGPGSVAMPDEELRGQELFFSFTSFFTPTIIYRYEIESGDLAIFEQVEAGIDTARYEAKQVHYPSSDGTRVSMFIIHPRDLMLDGDNPTILTGYGGFNISLTPEFQRMNLFWLEQGGVIAIPNLRGGSEYGERWHQGGMLASKQQVFDDFIAAAEWLIERRYTNPNRLAISGASNGGLLVGAALTQRPDLFKAVHCGVPLLDMVRYHQFYLGRLWISEYGCADDLEEFQWLYAYSPYHRVRSGENYPAVLFTTAESDSRVHPMHALKMAALLQHCSSSGNPVLLWVEPRAGHGAGKPIKKVVAEWTDIFSFFCWQLGIAR